ncbi:hypothetical protein JCM19239_7262 [Vibrio variabilis]|uniref:Uncharacterized protein n=1 Tax=Vibrio variabilis TaxID=990271 RepID=A0ABQ0J7C0_9VIBR|nr:hypothetical protein JCM19239_7262 [Vibrio variabilis]
MGADYKRILDVSGDYLGVGETSPKQTLLADWSTEGVPFLWLWVQKAT